MKKAKEYFEEFSYQGELSLGVKVEDLVRVNDLVRAMSAESKEILRARKVSSDRATAAVIAEMNQKWNAVSRLCKKKWGTSPMAEDGYQKFYIYNIPNLEPLLKEKARPTRAMTYGEFE